VIPIVKRWGSPALQGGCNDEVVVEIGSLLMGYPVWRIHAIIDSYEDN